VQAIADGHCPSGGAWAWNQCLMDLGAVLCRPSDPGCDKCPVASWCEWHAAGGADPAVGSAGVSVRQSRFDGSDRQARGRLMKALGEGPVAHARVASVMQRDEPTASRLVVALIAEGMCQTNGLTIRLPD
jgi:A/G-specific adenine glycosylase